MRDKAKEAQGFVADLTEGQFLEDNKTQSAVILKLAIIGEIAKKISPEAKDIIDLPWKEIAGFRNMAIHEYLQLSLTIIWATTQRPLSDLIAKIDAYLRRSDSVTVERQKNAGPRSEKA
jgi:uncharacterized protein with HEPN domain